MRNLIFLNEVGVLNVHPLTKPTVQINDDFYCEMNESELYDYVNMFQLNIINGKLIDTELNEFGTVLEL